MGRTDSLSGRSHTSLVTHFSPRQIALIIIHISISAFRLCWGTSLLLNDKKRQQESKRFCSSKSKASLGRTIGDNYSPNDLNLSLNPGLVNLGKPSSQLFLPSCLPHTCSCGRQLKWGRCIFLPRNVYCPLYAEPSQQRVEGGRGEPPS